MRYDPRRFKKLLRSIAAHTATRSGARRRDTSVVTRFTRRFWAVSFSGR
jgi:hypothetical protein